MRCFIYAPASQVAGPDTESHIWTEAIGDRMIDVDVTFADDTREQTVIFAVMPRLGEIVLVQFEHDVIPRAWLVDKVLHKIFPQTEPKVNIHVSPA